MDSAYASTRSGPLTLGGLEVKRVSKKHKKKKSKSKKREREDGDDIPEAAASRKNEEVVEQEEELIVIMSGAGRMSSSGTTIQGHDGTKFLAELNLGDAIIITHPTTHMDETRIVKMVLSMSRLEFRQHSRQISFRRPRSVS